MKQIIFMKSRLFVILNIMFSLAFSMEAQQTRVYINPGHGSWGPNDRPMATIPYPMLSSTGRPDTCGFYESNTNLWKCEELAKRLQQAGYQIKMSRYANGPFPYVRKWMRGIVISSCLSIPMPLRKVVLPIIRFSSTEDMIRKNWYLAVKQWRRLCGPIWLKP